jgi:hypothetical protein
MWIGRRSSSGASRRRLSSSKARAARKPRRSYPVRSSTDSSRVRLPIGPVRQSRSDEGVCHGMAGQDVGAVIDRELGKYRPRWSGRPPCPLSVSFATPPSTRCVRWGDARALTCLRTERQGSWGLRRRTHAPGVRLAADGPAHVASWPGHLPSHELITTACRELLLGGPASDSASVRRQDRGREEPTPSVHRGSSPRRLTDATKSRQQESDQ